VQQITRILSAVLTLWLAGLGTPADSQVDRGLAVAAKMTTTGKERLGDKASDDQRVNDCRVPPEKRGPIQRPTECESK
jgi:hypothetical protein